MKISTGLGAVLLAAGFLWGGRVSAETAPARSNAVNAPTAPTDHRTPEQLRREVLERMRALRAWKIVEDLRLDEATSARLFPILARYDDREMDIAAERHDVVQQLRAASEAPRPDDARLTAAINRLLAIRLEQRAVEDDRIRDLRKVLTPTQQAKLVLLLPRLEHDFAHWLREVAGRPGAGTEETP